MDDNSKILILRLSALGDTIHTLPLACAIKKEYPNAKIGWVVEDKAQQFVKNNPVVDKTFVLPKKKWKKRGLSFKNVLEFLAIVRRIKKENYDIVIDTQQLLKSSILMPFLGITRKLTHNDGREFSWLFANEFIKSRRKQFDVSYHVVNRNLEFAQYLGVKDLSVNFVLPKSSGAVVRKINHLTNGLDRTKKSIVLAPATTWANKHWEKSNWSKLIEEFQDEYNIILTGSNQDKGLILEILAGVNNFKGFDFSGETNLMELAELYKRVHLVISPDSGSAHIAWATGVPNVITIFCATSPSRTAPFGYKYYSFGANIACSPCMKRKCANKKIPLECTNVINFTKIVNTVKKILQ